MAADPKQSSKRRMTRRQRLGWALGAVLIVLVGKAVQRVTPMRSWLAPTPTPAAAPTVTEEPAAVSEDDSYWTTYLDEQFKSMKPEPNRSGIHAQLHEGLQRFDPGTRTVLDPGQLFELKLGEQILHPDEQHPVTFVLQSVDPDGATFSYSVRGGASGKVTVGPRGNAPENKH